MRVASSNLDTGSLEGLRFRLPASGLTTEINGSEEGANKRQDTLYHNKDTIAGLGIIRGTARWLMVVETGAQSKMSGTLKLDVNVMMASKAFAGRLSKILNRAPRRKT